VVSTFQKRAASFRPGFGLGDIYLVDLLYVAIFNLLFFEGVIHGVVGFSYIDEFVAVLLLVLAVLKWARGKRLLSVEIAIVGLSALLLANGFMGNYISGVQSRIEPIVIDAFTCFKFIITYISAITLLDGTDRILSLLRVEAKILVLVLFVLACANLVLDFGMRSDIRFSIPSFTGFWQHPTYLVFACVGLLALLSTEKDKNRIWIILIIVVIASSLRSKAFAMIGVFVVLLILVQREKKRLGFFAILVLACSAIVIGWDSFQQYYLTDNDSFARSRLVQTGFMLANHYFPIGTGFGTFGTYMSGEYYSPLYYQYGLSTVHGLTPSNFNFISDTFWPAIVGQFGGVGLISFALILVLIYISLKRRSIDRSMFIAVLTLFFYLMISSTSESAFFNPYAVYIAFSMALILGASEKHNGTAEMKS
jgi:hypothetical protein